VWLKEEERKKMEEDERTRVEECIAGSLVGLAVGDALGAPVEGRSGDEVAIILTGGHAPLRPAMAVDHWDEHCVRAACDAKKAHPHGEEGGAPTTDNLYLFICFCAFLVIFIC
jgi:hypothetical protein